MIVVGYPSYPVPNGPWIMIRAISAARATPGFMIAVTSLRYVRKSYRDHETAARMRACSITRMAHIAHMAHIERHFMRCHLDRASTAACGGWAPVVRGGGRAPVVRGGGRALAAPDVGQALRGGACACGAGWGAGACAVRGRGACSAGWACAAAPNVGRRLRRAEGGAPAGAGWGACACGAGCGPGA